MAIVVVTALSSAGQFTVFSYVAPYFREVLGAGPGQISLLFMWFGAFGVFGNVVLTRRIDRVGAARAAGWMVGLMALGMLLWPMGTSVATLMVVMVPWALGCFASNSAQQARLGQAAPALAPALMALNTSAIYFGQAAGAASGGLLITGSGYAWLHWVALGWMLLALGLSLWAARRMARDPHHV
jgi:predicted MFS family arabinose efflux permease